jgi:hypothetical protein
VRRSRIFTVMPIRPETEDLWELGIKETCEKLGFECDRADKLREPGFIVTQIYDQIRTADLVIGEMTGNNPNVFYEVGYAHALGIPTVLLASSREDLKAFDLSGVRHQIHEGRITKVREILETTLPHCLPGGEVIYDWPAAGVDAPGLKWEPKPEHRNSQPDPYGGQRFRRLPIGETITISNTDEHWNHQAKQSIMRLGRWTDEIRKGDRVSLFVDLRTTSSSWILLEGDGGYVNPEQRTDFACCWKDKKEKLQATSWATIGITADVDPTHPSYDPGTQGTMVHLITSTGTGDMDIKRIRLVRLRQDRQGSAKA